MGINIEYGESHHFRKYKSGFWCSVGLIHFPSYYEFYLYMSIVYNLKGKYSVL